MKRIIGLIVMGLAVSIPALTQNQPAKPAQDQKSAIPSESLVQFFKAQSQLVSASDALDKATEAAQKSLPQYADFQAKQTAFQGIVSKINTTYCNGTGLTLTPAGDLICSPPKPAEKPAAPAKK